MGAAKQQDDVVSATHEFAGVPLLCEQCLYLARWSSVPEGRKTLAQDVSPGTR